MDDVNRKVRTGRHRHYKGRDYEVIGVARHNETGEELVVYRCLYGDFSLWVRPLEMFLESVAVDGRVLPRFAWCGDEAALPDGNGALDAPLSPVDEPGQMKEYIIDGAEPGML